MKDNVSQQNARPQPTANARKKKVKRTTETEEAKQILSAGFDYVAEKSGIMLFRRPKRFSKCM